MGCNVIAMTASAILTTDDRTRLPLSKLGATPKSLYQAEARDDGTIVLTPLATIPAREKLVWENESLRQAIAMGLAEASAGLAHVNPELTSDLDRTTTD